jgi:hypothetical protein
LCVSRRHSRQDRFLQRLRLRLRLGGVSELQVSGYGTVNSELSLSSPAKWLTRLGNGVVRQQPWLSRHEGPFLRWLAEMRCPHPGHQRGTGTTTTTTTTTHHQHRSGLVRHVLPPASDHARQNRGGLMGDSHSEGQGRVRRSRGSSRHSCAPPPPPGKAVRPPSSSCSLAFHSFPSLGQKHVRNS